MNFLHTDFWGGSETTAIVTLDGQANVMLLGDADFASYKNGRSYNYYGGLATRTPVRLSAPHHGHWHVVVDLGGYAGSIRAGIKIVSHAFC